MTDKQIIIDGVDVSGCEDYKCDGTCANSAYHLFNFETKYGNCQNRNCHYKQLKRSEAQCEAMFVSHTDLEKKYKAKEQECEELKKIINEAKNSKLDLKSFLVGEAVQNEYEQQLDQLKADRKEALEQLEFVRTFNTVQEAEIRKYSKTLTEIKELLLKTPTDSQERCVNAKSVILQKISECEGNNEYS